MDKMTITEALAELKTIDKRLEKKRQSVMGYLFRQTCLKDPMEEHGGSKSHVSQERQAVQDIEKRRMNIRLAIQKTNLETHIEIAGETKSIAGWLVWRSDVATGRKNFLHGMMTSINKMRNDIQSKGMRVVDGDSTNAQSDVVINLNEKDLIDSMEIMETTLGELDGQLSLKNATTFVEI